MKDTYVATIGLEIHAELKTASKMFCGCANNPDEERPNANICPVCMGHPGTLPVLNEEAIKHVLKIGYAIGARVVDFTEWDRKNYFYPDIPKGYQITQFKYPLVQGGKIGDVELTRIHLEEDTARSTHDAHDRSLVDFNRAGVPLMELVTEPVIRSGEQAVKFAKELQLLLRYIGAGEANMEKGEMRVEANISIATPEDTQARKFGTKTEVKNLNSFRAVERAIAYEIERHAKLLEKGEKVVQETRGWDEAGQKTFLQRVKENSHDYRYFPDPDIPKLKISEVPALSRDNLTKETPELPWVKRSRLISTYSLTEKEAEVFVGSPQVGAYFESITSILGNDAKNAKLAANYVLSDLIGLVKKEFGEDIEQGVTKIDPKNFADLIKLVAGGSLSSRGAKDTLKIMYEVGGEPAKIAEEKGLTQKSDSGALEIIAKTIIEQNPNVVAEYKSGKEAVFQFFIGQGMKVTRGSANPEVLKEVFKKLLG